MARLYGIPYTNLRSNVKIHRPVILYQPNFSLKRRLTFGLIRFCSVLRALGQLYQFITEEDMKLLKWFSYSITCALLISNCGKIKHNFGRIGYVTLSGHYSSEDSAAIGWLEMAKNFHPEVVDLNQLSNKVKDVDVLWIHIPDSLSYQLWKKKLKELQILKLLYENGTKILLTDLAAFLPYELGIETQEPELKPIGIQDNWNFDKKGFESFRGHPIFKDLFGGAFIWDATSDITLPRVGYFEDNFPMQGKVVAVEKSYITIHADRRVVIEYENKAGKILTIGGFVYFSKQNQLKNNIEMFLENSFLYLIRRLSNEPRTYWQKFENIPKQFFVETKPIKITSKRALKNITHTELLLKRVAPQKDYFDVAGRRALIMGQENGGIEEFWVHPLRVLRDLEAGIITDGTVFWLKDLPVQVEVRPESFTRIYQTPDGALKEIIFASLNKGGGVIHYQADTQKPIQLIIKFRSDLRWMWPYDEKALGDLYYGYNEKLNALHIKDVSGDFYCLVGGDVKPIDHFTGQYKDIVYTSREFEGLQTNLNQVYHAFLYTLDSENSHILNFAIVGTNVGKSSALKDYADLLQNPEEEYQKIVKHYQDLLNNLVTIESPNLEFNTVWKWTLVGTDRFLVHTPSVGTALVAGYATTARGWDGGHKNSGRPGYAWYFGRDSEWSGFAIADCGDFELVKMQLEFLQKFQDLSGKIFHEISTSGVVHYDAADATPLYIILAAHYLRASGDSDFIKQSWPFLKKAMDFLYSTDTDGDLLIENTNVGHGWVEGGKLWGAHTTFYLAGLWAQTLKDAAYLTSHVGERELSDQYQKDATQVIKILNTDFWNDSTQFYNYGKFADGTYNPEKTVLPAVVMYYGLLEDEKVRNLLDVYAGNGFSADWGVRILSSESQLFNPEGYHYGSVWPLFTGWTALGEYRYGNSVQGFTHILNNLYIKNHWALGFVEEVMNGAVYKPSGVCPHQCWSETNVLHPAINGMIGWKPSAPERYASVQPRFPLHWNTVTVNNLRVGKSNVQLKMERQKNLTRYQFRLLEGPAVSIKFAPEIADGMVVKNVTLNGKRVEVSPATFREALACPVVFQLSMAAEIVLEHTKGVGMIPAVPKPRPGDVSQGYRIISANLDENRYDIVFEGKSGSTHAFEMMVFDQMISAVQGAKVEKVSNSGIVRLRVPFDHSDHPFVRKNVSVQLQ